MLDSFVTSVDLSDLIVLRKRKDRLSAVTMRGLGSESIPPEKNNALKAAEAFSETFGCNGAEITVYKNIPIGAGLGGSSADVVGVLNGMARMYGVTDRAALKALADRLGSDTGYMLDGGFARMQGRGERVTRLPIDKTLHFLLFCPPSSVSSGECYRQFDKTYADAPKRENRTEKCIAAFMSNEINDGGRYLTNALFEAAASLNGDVKAAFEAAQTFSPLGVTMTGSGGCVAALFETKELCEWAQSRYKGKCRTYVVKTVKPDYVGKKRSFFRNPFALSDEETEGLGE